MTVADVMTTDVLTVKTETPVTELAKLFTTRRISSIPVVDDAGKLIGLVTETDLVEQDKTLHIPTVISIFDWVIYLESDKKFEQELRKVTGRTVGDIYTKDVVTVSPTTDISEVADIMSSRKMNALPVIQDGRLVGIVARIDLIRSMISQ